jgi:hypothetical protein
MELSGMADWCAPAAGNAAADAICGTSAAPVAMAAATMKALSFMLFSLVVVGLRHVVVF